MSGPICKMSDQKEDLKGHVTCDERFSLALIDFNAQIISINVKGISR